MKYLLFIIVCSLVFSCTHVNEVSIEDLETEVMAIHDSVMPKMTKIYYDREKLEEWISDSSNIASPELFEDVTNNIRALKIAEDAMWQWMSDFDEDRQKYEGQADSIKLEYLVKNKTSIIEVRDLMLSSMNKADSLHSIIEKNKE